MKTLTDAGYRAIAFDNRGHGASSKSYDPADYHPGKMAGDAAALLAPSRHRAGACLRLFDGRAHLRVPGAWPSRRLVATLIFGGLGIGMVDGVGDWDPIAEALVADRSRDDRRHPRGRMFRTFADQTKSDRKALAACIATSRELLSEADVSRITQPTLIAVGTKDDIGGSAEALAALMPNAVAFAIEGRDHMLSVGDRTFKKRALEFLKGHPIRSLSEVSRDRLSVAMPLSCPLLKTRHSIPLEGTIRKIVFNRKRIWPISAG